jgi:hypothetical protein
VGLGPTTVVRLKSALAHEVLRYCTAIRGSVLKVVRGTRWDDSTHSMGQGSPSAFETLIGHNRKPAATATAWDTRACEKGPQQASSTVREPTLNRLPPRYGSRQGTVKLTSFAVALCHRMGRKRPMVVRRGYPCQADTPVSTRLSEHEHLRLRPSYGSP